MKNIKFYTNLDIEKEYYPQPASKLLPEWYKELNSYIHGKKEPIGNGETSGTMKKCVPVFDAITAGYIITLPADVFVTQKDGEPYYEWSNYGLVSFHNQNQAPTHPNRNGHNTYPKWINPWAIQTPSGYSVLIVQPLHRESNFTILPGIIDTDTYTAPINFPFVLNDKSYEGLIPAGTPIAQIIPIKRENWKMEFSEINNFSLNRKMGSKMFDRYKTLFWHKKDYK
jgi:hypothetical protein